MSTGNRPAPRRDLGLLPVGSPPQEDGRSGVNEVRMLPLIWGIVGALGFALALVRGGTWRRTAALLLVGLAFGMAWLVVGYFMATPSDQRPDCSDCYVYLGRWWEPGFAVFIIGLTFVAWMLGVLVGSVARAIKLRRAGPGT